MKRELPAGFWEKGRRLSAELIARELVASAPRARTPADMVEALGVRLRIETLPTGFLGFAIGADLAEAIGNGFLGRSMPQQPDLIAVHAGQSDSEIAFTIAHEMMHLRLGDAAAPAWTEELEAQCDAGAEVICKLLSRRSARMGRTLRKHCEERTQ